MKRAKLIPLLGIGLGMLLMAGCARDPLPQEIRSEAIRKDPIPEFPGEGWIGYAIAYSGYREGQEPNGEQPTREQVREDLHILAPHWTFIRTYSASQHARDVLEVIREDKLPIRVMQGAWLVTEDPQNQGWDPENPARNDREIEQAVALAKEFPETIVAINVGNEILVDWSFQPVGIDRVIELVERTQAQVDIPVTVADNYVPWTEPQGIRLSKVVDFVTLHSYPLWVKQPVENALQTTIDNFNAVREAVGPDKRILIGEAGWATFTADDPQFHAPGAGSPENQVVYFRELHDWAIREGVPVFWFEAFDEPWKDPNGTEGFWGLYDVHRNPRPAMHP